MGVGGGEGKKKFLFLRNLGPFWLLYAYFRVWKSSLAVLNFHESVNMVHCTKRIENLE